MTNLPTSHGVNRNYYEVTWADLPTFGKAPLTDVDQLEGADVAVYGIPWDGTASPKGGARLAPRRIREETGLFHEVWNPLETPMIGVGTEGRRTRERLNLVDCGDVAIFPFDVERTGASIRALSSAIAAHAFPMAIGGDHYVMYPAYQGVCDAHPDLQIGIVQIDAHDDTVDDDPILGKHWCGSPIQRAMEHGTVDPRAVAIVGLRNFTSSAAAQRHREEGFVTVTMDEARELGPATVAEKAVSSVLRHCDAAYLTIDVDAADPSCAPGCSSPSPGGFLGHEFMALVRALGSSDDILAMDFVEVAPPVDPTEQTTVFAAHALFHFVEARFLQS